MARLTPEQRADLERQLAADDAADDDFEISIRDGDKETRVPYSKGRSWLQKHFDIDLDEPAEADPGDEPKGKPAGEVRRFGGRRVS